MLASLVPCSVFANYASTDYVKTAIQTLFTDVAVKINEANTGAINRIESLQKQIITHQIGEIFQGGIVFYVDASGQHGLMASRHDLGGEGIEWRNGEGGDKTVNARAEGLGGGETNTRLIIAEQTIDEQEGLFAALLASNYQISADGKTPCDTPISTNSTCFSGWYLPSVYELMLLFTNFKNQGLGKLSNAPYWSSTESSTTEAWLMDFSAGHAEIAEKSTLARVRAIHAF